ncbi:MAG: hypothetical protein UU81_C0008G0014 [Microgenomates group bacterium GW2011_GWC1_41_8]|uniref:Uncharacterized protein n=1 Tax=Candidatus Roizmanbacteria bacterium GW2011_GWA1_41_13 TaxID=1618474 RepID=A0A0G0Y1M1_9BACT|nr:MAG: hypothetical protein UU41_C0012G0009 [Candidatus Roizmanbacteria bacterium GW2011_GWA1_41_13]KKS24398.1 MAG: hypothetical protein UU81_C0008G0014 [Microgenomates group bacterium GW2011_GWC1_41_8]OGK50315.1 MAG: hypothetical protein A3A55_01290 [Candidatus Roizmanbacteria bacterium RIFCSPLOWO2_01_FULL_40_14]
MKYKRTGVIFIDKPPILTEPQISVLSEIIRNIGFILSGSTVVPFLFDYVDKPTTFIVVLALLTILISFATSLILIRNNKIL